jgi:hypothetical protein
MLGMTTSPVHARNTFGTLLGQKRAVTEGRLSVSGRVLRLRWNTDAAVAGEVRAANRPFVSERECKRVRARSIDSSIAHSRGQLPRLRVCHSTLRPGLSLVRSVERLGAVVALSWWLLPGEHRHDYTRSSLALSASPAQMRSPFTSHRTEILALPQLAAPY